MPSEFKEVPIKNSEIAQKNGIKLIESAYPEKKVIINAKSLFNYNNGRFNSIRAQLTELNSEQTFENEFKRANEIVIKSIIKNRPKAEFEKKISRKTIDKLEFKTFNLKTLNKSGKNYEMKVFSKMFGMKKLDIIIVSDNKEKKKITENIVLNSEFD